LYALQKSYRDFGLFIGNDYMIAIEKPIDAHDFSEYDEITVLAGCGQWPMVSLTPIK